jgi:large subunit ribosomal protein L17
MKKRIRFRQLGRTSSHKWAMLRNMVTSLIEHERIVTTVAKAKEVQPLAEKIITMVKRNTPSLQSHSTDALGQQPQSPPAELLQQPYKAHFNAYRPLNKIVRTPQATAKAVEVLGPRYQFRNGGYTRVLKLSERRAGDNAPMALIEYVDRPGEVRAARPPAALVENAPLWLEEIEEEDDEEDADEKMVEGEVVSTEEKK